MRDDICVALLNCLLLLARGIEAQGTATPAPRQSMGDTAFPINGPWKFHTGDNPEWSAPGFDDSAWQDYILDPKASAPTAAGTLGAKRLPGWQAHGHPSYTGYAWYRIRLSLPRDLSSLSLMMPQHVDDIYEVYFDGRKIGGFGKLGPHPVVYSERSKVFSLPSEVGLGKESTVLALRFWDTPSYASPVVRNLRGGLRALPLVGPSQMIEIFKQSLLHQVWKRDWPQWVDVGLFSAVGLISLFLFSFSRSDREYLWAGVSMIGFATALSAAHIEVEQDLSVDILRVFGFSVLFALYALPLALMYLLEVHRLIWCRLNRVVLVFFTSGSLLARALEYGLQPFSPAMNDTENGLYALSLLSLACLLIAIAIDGLRTIGKKAWLPLVPGILFACGLLAQFAASYRFLSVSVDFVFYGGVPIAILIIFLLRFVRQQQDNARLLDDMKQAQAVQQVLLPEAQTCIPGFTVESVYRPAREVGGDFFQIVPHPSGDNFLVVLGDVTGKGLQAGMLVALIVGTIRTEAAHTEDPAQILAMLNTRLHARNHDHATCLAFRVESTGAVTLANAGHLPPYLNGNEIPMEGALPLGTLSEAAFPILHLHLNPTDRLTVMSDGIAEAQDKAGTLFGFERIAAMLKAAATAAVLAAAAQTHGQEDDILVLQITRFDSPESPKTDAQILQSILA